MKNLDNLQNLYFNIFKKIKKLDVNEVYTLLEALKEGFEAYDFLRYNSEQDDIDEIEKDLQNE